MTLAALVAAIWAVDIPHHAQATMQGVALQRYRHPLTSLQARDGRSATLQLQAIPEPQTWIVAGAGLGTLVALQRFRRRRG